MKYLFIVLMVWACGCNNTTKETQEYTIRTIIKGDTFYLMNKVPLTLSEAQEMVKKDTVDHYTHTIVLWDSVYEVWNKGTHPVKIVHDTVWQNKTTNIDQVNTLTIN